MPRTEFALLEHCLLWSLGFAHESRSRCDSSSSSFSPSRCERTLAAQTESHTHYSERRSLTHRCGRSLFLHVLWNPLTQFSRRRGCCWQEPSFCFDMGDCANFCYVTQECSRSRQRCRHFKQVVCIVHHVTFCDTEIDENKHFQSKIGILMRCKVQAIPSAKWQTACNTQDDELKRVHLSLKMRL